MIFSPPSSMGLQQALQIPCSPDRIAAAWYYALTEDCAEECRSPETLQQFIKLTRWGCAELQTVPVNVERAAVIGAALVDMGFKQPACLGRTIATWSSHLLESVSADAFVALCPLLRALLHALSEGFIQRLQQSGAIPQMDGQLALPEPSPTGLGLGHLPGPARQRSAAALSANDTTMLQLLMAGKTNREISVMLMISEKAVEKRLTKLFATLNVKSRTEAIAWALQIDTPTPPNRRVG